MSTSSHSILLAALDLDGTLLNSNGKVSPCTQKVLSEASDRGVVVIPATGRPLASLPPVVAKLPGIRYAITSNGAAVWDLGSDPLGAVYSRYANAAERQTSEPTSLLRRLMPVETAREAFAVCESCHADLRIFSDGYACTDARSIALAAARAAQKVIASDAIPASLSAGAALHAAAQLIANGTSRSALAIFSGRQNII